MKKIVLIITLSLLGQIVNPASCSWLKTLEGLIIKAIKEGKDISHLLILGVSPNAKAKYGYTLLHVAVYYNNLKAVNRLIKSGANINSQNTWNGKTPLYIALKRKYIRITQALLNAGAYVNTKNAEGNTPLHMAVKIKNIDIVKALLEKGADINSKDDVGYTPLHKALDKNNIKIVKLLIEHNANINAQNDLKRTPLYYVVKYKYLYLIKLLIDNGANPLIKDICGKTSLDIIKEEYQEDIESYNSIKDIIVGFQPNPLFQKDISNLFNQSLVD